MSGMIGNRGVRQDLLIKQGSDFGFFLSIKKTDNITPEDLTGCTFKAHIRKTPSQTTPTAVFAISIIDAAGGLIGVSLSNKTTSGIKCGTTENDFESLYEYDLEYKNTSNVIKTLMYGQVKIVPEITKG